MSKSSCLCTDMDNGFLLIFHIVELRQLKLNFVLLEAVSMRSENPTIRSTPSLGSYHNVAFETVRLTDDGPLLSFQGRSSSASSFYCCLLQAIDCVMSLALCPQVLSQAPQNLISCEGWLSVCLLGHFLSLRHVQGSTPTGVFEGGPQVWTSHSTFQFL